MGSIYEAPEICEERKQYIERLKGNCSLYGIAPLKKKTFFDRVVYFLETKWSFKITFTLKKIPPVDVGEAHWPKRLVESIMEQQKEFNGYNMVGGIKNG